MRSLLHPVCWVRGLVITTAHGMLFSGWRIDGCDYVAEDEGTWPALRCKLCGDRSEGAQ